MFTFVTGGFRSGRSNYALRRAAELGPPPWCYASSGVIGDDAITKRIEKHRKGEDAIWKVVPMPKDLNDLLAPEHLSHFGAIVLDGFAHWLEQRIDSEPELRDCDVVAQVETLAELLYRANKPVVVVSRELGLARLPDREDESRIVRLTTSANQILAASATGIVFMISGVPMRVR